MTIIKPNSIAGITSITAQGDVINVYKSDGTAAGLQLNGVNFNTTSGISTFNNLTIGGTITYQDVSHVDSVGIITAQQGIQVLANGINVTGFSTVGAVSASNVNITGIATVGTALSLADNVKAQFGTGGDLQIYHDGSNNYIHNGNNGINNIFKSDYFVFQENQSGDYYIRARADTGAVDLYNQNTIRLSTADGGVVVTGVMTATQFSGGGIGVGIQSAGNLIGYGITTLNFVGSGNTFAINGTTVDVSIAGGGGGGGSSDGSDFNTGITSSLTALPVGVGTTVLTLPSTAGKQYLVSSILASNVATGNTEVNIIGAFDFTSGYGGGERSYFAYNIPIPTGTSLELLEESQILNPNDRITVRSTDVNRNGVDNAVELFITYEEKTSSDYFGIGISTVGLAVTSAIGIFTSTTYPSIVQSIRVVNRTDDGDYPISVDVTSGVTTIRIVDNLIVPKYGSVELLSKEKRLYIGDEIKVQVDQVSTIDVQVSGKKITS